MKVVTVRVGCLFNTGNYENQKYELEARLEEGDTVEAVADRLKHAIHLMADKEGLYHERAEMRREIADLERRVAEGRAQWEQTAAFLKAQGLRADPPDFPLPAPPLLAAASQTVETEIVDD